MEQRAQNYVESDGKSLPNLTSYSNVILTEQQHTRDVLGRVSLVRVLEPCN